MKIMNVYDPVKATKTDGKVTFEVVNRQYVFTEKSVFPSSIIACGNELLSAPIKVCASVNGKECEFTPADTRIIIGDDDESRTAVSSMESASLVVDTSHTVEFDGCDIINLTIAPRGITPGSLEVLYGKRWDEVFHLDNLSVEVPLSKKYVKYYQAYPFHSRDLGRITGKKVYIENDNFSVAGNIPDGGFDVNFKEQVYLFGRNGGVGFFFESDKGWNYSDNNKVMEVIETEDSYVLKIHFFDSEPLQWKEKDYYDRNSRALFPISIKFGMMVTPIKPVTDEMQYEKNIQIDCMKRFPQQHDEFLSNPIVEGSDEIGFDRLKRLGVETLYIHEKWNDIQNSYLLTEESEKRLKYIIEECHKRGMKVVPYFGYELSSLSPLFGDYGTSVCRTPYVTPQRYWFWYRTPSQRAMTICMDSDWKYMFFNGLKDIIEKYGFDGFNFDGTLQPKDCINQSHGCGYIDATGKLKPTYSVFGTREFAKNLYRLAAERGVVVNFHPCGCHSLAVLGFCSSLFEGEFFQVQMMKGELSELPEGCLQALMDYTSTGVPVQALCYVNPPAWTFHEAVGMMLVHNSVPKTVCWEDGLEEMSKIWTVYDAFKKDGVKWKPYYQDGCPATTKTADVLVSCYEREDKILAIVATSNRAFNGKALIETVGKNVVDAVSGKTLSENGTAEVELNGFDYKLLLIDKK